MRKLEDVKQHSETGTYANVDAVGPITTPSRSSPETVVAHIHSPATKVSSISNTNENKGVNIYRSYEVPGKSSTDGTATDVGGLFLDAIAKDKRVLQERLKKILAVNFNKQNKETFQILKPELDVDPNKNPYFDARVGIDKDNFNKLLRPKRMTIDSPKCSTDAEIIKMKANQVQTTKTKAEPDINPNIIEVGERLITKEEPKESIPDIEWWDVPFLQSGTYCDIDDAKMKMDETAIYIEHPQPIDPLSEPASPPPQPLKLTKQEQKKLRTQLRLAREKDKQEMIRQSIIEPPKPKVKVDNLIKVLGSEATQYPTQMEMEIKSAAAAEREQSHIDRSNTRKRTSAERREKKERRLFGDTNKVDTIVSVYKINDLSDPKARSKVDKNANENRLSGFVEGGVKSIRRYRELMLRRINWSDVRKGSVAKPNFNGFSIREFRTGGAARKYFLDHCVGHYWDTAVNFTEDMD
ncbi:hypothetical protein ACJIZ3_022718 [Penstemon smallii]|uniref:Pre-mRNA-splicing factor 3 domain-containing protein n=1 Tax=Penstemon smallii TaxID=265156 RepID=A0ABD3TM12_9LAMI